MNRVSIIRRTVVASFVLAGIASGVALQPAQVRAETADDHPDFLWWPKSVSNSRLYVGNLTWGGGSDSTVEFNPFEFTVDKPVP